LRTPASALTAALPGLGPFDILLGGTGRRVSTRCIDRRVGRTRPGPAASSATASAAAASAAAPAGGRRRRSGVATPRRVVEPVFGRWPVRDRRRPLPRGRLLPCRRLAPRRPLGGPLSWLLRRVFRGLGGRLPRGVRRPLEDRGEAVRRRPLSRRGFGLSIHDHSLRSERGGDPDPARLAAEGSFAINVPSPAQRRSPRAGLKTCSYNRWSCPGPRRLAWRPA
jgi:hypothetical protein